MSYDETVYWFILSLTLNNVGAQLLHFCDTNGKDPCEVANETMPYEPEARYVNCDPPSIHYCDRYIVPGWYRYKERMWDQCPSLAKCGAVYPNWLNGAHPTEVNTEVLRTVCKVGFSSCCERNVTIKIRNCGQFMAYCLPALDTCPERYCFGESGPCTSTTSQTTTNIFTTSTNATTVATTTITESNSPQSATTSTYLRTTEKATNVTTMASNFKFSASIKTTRNATTVATSTNTESNSPQSATTSTYQRTSEKAINVTTMASNSTFSASIKTTRNATTVATSTNTESNSPQSATTSTYQRTSEKATNVAAMASNSTFSANIKTTTEILQTVKAKANDEPSPSTTVIVMGVVIGILLIFIVVGSGAFVFYRKCYRNRDTDGNTYDEPFTPLQENTYETSANVYTNEEEGGYEQLPVDQNAKPGYPVQSEDPYDDIDDRIQSGLPRKEEINWTKNDIHTVL